MKLSTESVTHLAKRACHIVGRNREFFLGLFVYVLLRPELANAGILSRGICRPYRQLVDNELFVVVGAIAAVCLVVAWKLGNGNTALSKGVGLLAALFIGLNIENLLTLATGQGLLC